jgi:hypothetical protein
MKTIQVSFAPKFDQSDTIPSVALDEASRHNAQMEEGSGIAEVTGVTKHPVVEVAEGVEVGSYTVHAKMYVPAVKYSNDFYLVKIMEPKGLDYLQPERGWQMERGESHETQRFERETL